MFRVQTDQSSEETRTELSQLRDKERLAQQRNRELQHMLLDLEAKLDAMRGQTQSASNLVRGGVPRGLGPECPRGRGGPISEREGRLLVLRE